MNEKSLKSLIAYVIMGARFNFCCFDLRQIYDEVVILTKLFKSKYAKCKFKSFRSLNAKLTYNEF